MNNTEKIAKLIYQSKKGAATPDELQELELWANSHPDRRAKLNQLNDKDYLANAAEKYLDSMDSTERVLVKVKERIRIYKC